MYDLRANGITTFEGARVFQKLRARRLAKMRRKAANSSATTPATTWEWKQLVPKMRVASGVVQIQQHCMDLCSMPTKRRSTPLSIIGSVIVSHVNIPQTLLSVRAHNIILANFLQFSLFSGLPNYDKLSADERQLCSTVRVVPDAFLAYKKILIAENTKVGYLRLADARRLVKIDVNKTRVMYDFFFEHGFINKPFA